jgi:aminoglycoside phosphotransferase (APT) family kinase protein
MTPVTNSSDRPGDEPSLSGEEWVEYGGELIWAIDFTAGGAPIGLTSKEFRRLNAALGHRAGWARAKSLLAWAFEACSSPVADIEIGRVKKVGEGLFRKVYVAHVDLSPDPDDLSGAWAVLLPDRRATTEDCRRWVREVAILGQLARERLPFRVPAPLGAFPDGDHPAIIRRFIDGIPADLRAGRMPSIRPAQLVGQIAAAIHAIDVTAWRPRPPGGTTRRGHAEELMRVFDELEGTEVGPAREWAVQHLPQDRAAVLVHGDLLGQNILMFPDEAPAVIDWEFCRIGDPAFDLAIVTRGVRRPFQMARGLDRLLEAYAAAGGDPIARSEVHLYELCLAARWYREALRGRGSEPPEQALARLLGILRRAEASTR